MLENLKSFLKPVVSVTALALVLGGCGGGGGGSTTSGGTVGTAGIGLPTEVSAIPSSNDDTVGSSRLASGIRRMAAAAQDLGEDTDYKLTKTAKYVDEPTLEVFGIIETILKAIAQTHYDAPENIGSAPYKTIVAWYEEREGRTQKELEEWFIQSEMDTDADGQPINVVHVWINDPEEAVSVETRISQAPSQDEDGNYLDYGKWTISANMQMENRSGFFFAEASIGDNGQTILKMSENFPEEIGNDGQGTVLNFGTKAIMHKSQESGYGLAQIPDYDFCWERDENGDPLNDCSGLTQAPTSTLQYAYNQDYLALQEGAQTLYKDRNDTVKMVYRYGLFDAITGTNVEKDKTFGFPVRYTVGESTMHGYYGAWQGRHELWADGGTLPDGTMVTPEEVEDSQQAESYTTKTFDGALTKRILAAAELEQIENIPVEIWLGKSHSLKYDASAQKWFECLGGETYDPELDQYVCAESVDFSDSLSSLIVGENSRKNVNINGWAEDGQGGGVHYEYLYDGTGFKEVTGWDQNSPIPGNAYVPSDGDTLWVWISGSTYIQYTGNFSDPNTGWVEKALINFDYETWTPTFDANGDTTFEFPVDNEYYINNKGVNYVVKRVGTAGSADDYEVKMELQQVANPVNAATLISADTIFKNQWDTEGSTYEFVTDPENAAYLMLVYQTLGANDQDKTVGDVVQNDHWGLVANSGSTAQTDNQGNLVQFNWEYQASENDWGSVTYLVGNDGYLLLDDPIMLDPITLTSLGGRSHNFSLQFDGWMHGMPDMHWELEKNDYIVTKDIKNKVVNIPPGTEVTETASGKKYFVKPLEVGVVLKTVTAPEAGKSFPDPGLADGIDFSSLPDQVTVDIGALPATAVLKYIEGKSVE